MFLKKYLNILNYFQQVVHKLEERVKYNNGQFAVCKNMFTRYFLFILFEWKKN